jgi:hypothetical protein
VLHSMLVAGFEVEESGDFCVKSPVRNS